MIDDTVRITITATESASPSFSVPCLISVNPEMLLRVRRYTHWTQVALVFGDERDKRRARKWLKRKSRMLRKKRRGWA